MTIFKIRLESFTPVLLYKNVTYLKSLQHGVFFPFPTKKKKITVLRSPHIDKKSREQFELCTHSGQFIITVKPDAAINEVAFLSMIRANIFSGVRCTIKKEICTIL